MRDILLEIRTLLYANPELIIMLGGKRVYKLDTSDGKQYPRVILSEIDNPDTDYADDTPMAIEHLIQVSIFDKKETLAIFNAIDPIMKTAGWIRTFNYEFYEEDVKVYNRPLRYRKKYLNE